MQQDMQEEDGGENDARPEMDVMPCLACENDLHVVARVSTSLVATWYVEEIDARSGNK